MRMPEQKGDDRELDTRITTASQSCEERLIDKRFGAGLDRDAQIDQEREQVGATGVIPIKTFLDGLRAVGYDGPMAIEPFNAAIKAMTPEEAVRATSAALDRVLDL
jgi:sugar phosphate isomerase/epimerase